LNGVPAHVPEVGVMTYLTTTAAVVVLSRFSFIADVAPLPIGLAIPTTTALVHAKVAPAVELVAVYAVDALSQIVFVAALVITAVGLTVTSRLNGVPAHVPEVGVITYLTTTDAVVVLSRLSFIDEVAPLPIGFAIPTTTALVQAKVAPAVELVAVYPRGVLSHIVAVAALVITAVGLTVTSRLNGVPAHTPMVGVIIYLTTTDAVVVLSRLSFIDEVAPLPIGLAIPTTTALVQAKVAPAVELVAVYPRGVLSHTVAVAALVMTAVGWTVTSRLNGVPAHVPEVGVITYLTTTGAVVVLSRLSFIDEVAPLPIGLAIPTTTALVQAKVAPAVELVAVYAVDALSQIVFVAALVITAVGLTVTVRFIAVPRQAVAPGPVGVIA
jgi:hypothetical protein